MTRRADRRPINHPNAGVKARRNQRRPARFRRFLPRFDLMSFIRGNGRF